MGLSADTMVTELQDRGFSDLSSTRALRYVNAGRAELDRMYLWPWREKSVTGTSPVSVTDLGVIESVTNETQDYRLYGRQFRDLLDCYGDLSISGTPECYYTAWPSGTPAIATYPSNSDTIGVQYWKVTADISGSTEPDSPDEAHYLIVDLAVRRACRDVGDHAGAEAIDSEVQRQLDALLMQYPPGVGDDPGHVISPGPGWWW